MCHLKVFIIITIYILRENVRIKGPLIFYRVGGGLVGFDG